MTIYIDSEYKCHTSPGDGLREFDVARFDGCCPEFIEGYLFVPDGETYVDKAGNICTGEMYTPWKPYEPLYKAQLEYELAQAKAELADADEALAELGVNIDG